MASRLILFPALKSVYSNYGGIRKLFSSEYFWLSLVITLLCWRLVLDERWIDIGRSIIPTLSGVSIASYAIFFVVLNEDTRSALMRKDSRIKNKVPLLAIFSPVNHAIIMQIIAIILSIVYSAKPFPTINGMDDFSLAINLTFSFFGAFICIYSIVIILGPLLSIFKILESRTRVANSNNESID